MQPSERNEQLFNGVCQFLSRELTAAGSALFTAGEGVQRMHDYLDKLDNPQESFKTVHIAGTSGKGTIAYMIEALLRQHSFRTGLHVSPHVYDVRERCMIDGELIPKKIFAEIFERNKEPLLSMDATEFGRPTYFETMTAMAFDVFRDYKIDYAVVETGLGGLYDGTNSIARPDKLAVINALGHDHTEILGSRLHEIALQKAGILPWGGEAIVLNPSDNAARNAIEKCASERDTAALFIDAAEHISNRSRGTFSYDGRVFIHDIVLPSPGGYQVQNAVMALRVLEHLAERDGFKIDPEAVRKSFQNLSIPGRFERRSIDGVTVILDGAHNGQKFEALTDALAESDMSSAVWLLSLKQGKDIDTILDIISPRVSSLVSTEFYTLQDGQRAKNALAANDIAEAAGLHGIAAQPITQPDEALEIAVRLAKKKGLPLVIAGSFYLLGNLFST